MKKIKKRMYKSLIVPYLIFSNLVPSPTNFVVQAMESSKPSKETQKLINKKIEAINVTINKYICLLKGVDYELIREEHKDQDDNNQQETGIFSMLSNFVSKGAEKCKNICKDIYNSAKNSKAGQIIAASYLPAQITASEIESVLKPIFDQMLEDMLPEPTSNNPEQQLKEKDKTKKEEQDVKKPLTNTPNELQKKKSDDDEFNLYAQLISDLIDNVTIITDNEPDENLNGSVMNLIHDHFISKLGNSLKHESVEVNQEKLEAGKLEAMINKLLTEKLHLCRTTDYEPEKCTTKETICLKVYISKGDVTNREPDTIFGPCSQGVENFDGKFGNVMIRLVLINLKDLYKEVKICTKPLNEIINALRIFVKTYAVDFLSYAKIAAKMKLADANIPDLEKHQELAKLIKDEICVLDNMLSEIGALDFEKDEQVLDFLRTYINHYVGKVAKVLHCGIRNGFNYYLPLSDHKKLAHDEIVTDTDLLGTDGNKENGKKDISGQNISQHKQAEVEGQTEKRSQHCQEQITIEDAQNQFKIPAGHKKETMEIGSLGKSTSNDHTQTQRITHILAGSHVNTYEKKNAYPSKGNSEPTAVLYSDVSGNLKGGDEANHKTDEGNKRFELQDVFYLSPAVMSVLATILMWSEVGKECYERAKRDPNIKSDKFANFLGVPFDEKNLDQKISKPTQKLDRKRLICYNINRLFVAR